MSESFPEPVSVNMGPSMDFQAPAIKRLSKSESFRFDLLQVEGMAALGLRGQAIALNLGTTTQVWSRVFSKKDSPVREAWERGNARWQLKLAQRMDKLVQSPATDKNPAGLIFSLKQPHGAGWTDVAVKDQGQPEDNKAQLAFERRRKDAFKLPGAQEIITIEPNEKPAA